MADKTCVGYVLGFGRDQEFFRRHVVDLDPALPGVTGDSDIVQNFRKRDFFFCFFLITFFCVFEDFYIIARYKRFEFNIRQVVVFLTIPAISVIPPAFHNAHLLDQRIACPGKEDVEPVVVTGEDVVDVIG